jgi:RNA polymerase sigma-70 factor (ECF subfamily)
LIADRTSTIPSEDSELLARFIAGDSGACRLVERWAREIVRFRPYGIPRPEHEDVVQESIGMVWRACSKPGFSLRTGLRALTRRIVLARCVDHLRRRRVVVPLDHGLPDTQPGPEQAAANTEQWARVRWAIQQLDEGGQEIVRLHFLDEIPYAELADRLGLATPTVRGRVFQCMRQVRQLLDERRGAMGR